MTPTDARELLRAIEDVARSARIPVVVLAAGEPFAPFAAEPGEPTESRTIVAGGVVLDRAAHRLHVDGVEVALTATEYRLLSELLDGAGRVQTRERLLTEIWGYASDVESRTIDTHIRRLRRKLGGHAPRIETVIGYGYRFRQ